MKKLLVTMFLAFGVATPLAVADTGSAVVLVDAGTGSGSGSAATSPPDDTGSAVATAPAQGSDAASKLHDPGTDLAKSISDVQAAKKYGWAGVVFVVLLMLLKLAGRAKSLPIVGTKLAFLGEGKAATVIAGAVALTAASYDSLTAGGSLFAALVAGGLAVVHYIDATPPPKPAT